MTIALPRQKQHSDWLSRIRTVQLALGGRGVMGLGLGRSSVSAAAGNGLLSNLVGYWTLDEAAGANDALDAHVSDLHATQSNSPGATTGKVYATARSFNGTNQLFYRATEAALTFGDTDFTVAAWLYNLSYPTVRYAVTKYNPAGAREWALLYAATGYYRWFVSGDGGTLTQPSATSFGLAGTGNWHLVIAYHDSVANEVGICVNAGAVNALAHTTGVYSGTAHFSIGGATATGGYWYGNIGPVAMWQSAPGGGGVLTADQRFSLYNAGNGLPYASFTT